MSVTYICFFSFVTHFLTDVPDTQEGLRVRKDNISHSTKKTQQNSLIIPVTLKAGVRNLRLVCVCLEGVGSIDTNRRLPAGDRVTDRWRPAPPETCQTLELVWDLREEALHTPKQTETCMEVGVRSMQNLPAVMTTT